MDIPSTNVRDYPNMTRVVNDFVGEINDKNPYTYHGQKANIWNVRYYSIEDNAFVIEYDWYGSPAAMSIEFGSRGRLDGDGGNKDGKDRKDPPISRILEWVKKKGIKGGRRRSGVTGRYIRSFTQFSIALWVKRKVGEHGTKAKKWAQQMIDETFPKYEPLLDAALAADIDYQMQKYYPDLVK